VGEESFEREKEGEKATRSSFRQSEETPERHGRRTDRSGTLHETLNLPELEPLELANPPKFLVSLFGSDARLTSSERREVRTGEPGEGGEIHAGKSRCGGSCCEFAEVGRTVGRVASFSSTFLSGADLAGIDDLFFRLISTTRGLHV
jgi:hypothetical protein